jgi:predicted flap endonuclease-1-like 5' DNA nuclease
MKSDLDAINQLPGMTPDKAIKLYDYGFKTVDMIKQTDEDDIALVEGISKVDARRIHDFLHKDEPKAAPPAPTPSAPAAPAAVSAPATPPPPEPPAAPQKSFLDTLHEVEGIDARTAHAIYDAGYLSTQSVKSAALKDLAKAAGITETAAALIIDHFMGMPEEAPAKKAEPEVKPAAAVKDLERSFSYLVEEDMPETSYLLFLNAMNKGMKGYCITRNYPAKIRSKFDLKDTPVIWLSNVGRENTIRPKDLEKLSLSLEQFLSQAGGGIVLLDGLEYLITNNNFITVLRLIQSLRDQVAINQSILLMAVNRSTLESHQLNLLEREVDYTITG